jgi:hypothetical protein
LFSKADNEDRFAANFAATWMIKLKMADLLLLHNFYFGVAAVFPLARCSE